ncbi:MAG TPA: hypothetical protein VFA56_06120 [Gaiellaceae bacterium]|nr:hypothetical protein [Gaiellaceae bacterium]
MLVLAAASIVLGAGVAAASPPSPDNPAGAGADVLGVVPTKAEARAYAARAGSGGNLVYHGGKVLRTNKTVSIFWDPNGTFAPGYASTIEQYFADVAAASGQTTNVYSVLSQYYDGTGSISYSSTHGAAVVDSNPYPASGCADTVAQTTTCLQDSQIRAELQKVVKSPDPNTTYFVFTGKGVGSCYSSTSCAFSSYCAYHMNLAINGVTVQYANQPYAMTVPSACDTGYHPNGANDADATINVASHEHRESINDPLGTAWYDRRGYEGSDKCAWNFGAVTGDYNQSINGHHYILQQEWSNAASACRLRG